MPTPEERPAAAPAPVQRPPLLLFGGLGLILAGTIWLACEQTRPRGGLPPPVEAASVPPRPPVPTIETPAEEAAVALATRLAPDGTESDSGAAVPDRYEVTILIERNDSLARILGDLGIDAADRARAEAAFK